jgi:D-threo-aldose 1-dehydrogenase
MQTNKQNIELPKIVFGTSALGNCFVALDDDVKQEIVKECIKHTRGKLVFDSAGKYGAGLALESLSKCLKALNVAPEDVIINNKLGWVRTELKTPEPTFEPGVWRDLKHDAVQKISYDGILECYEQGNQLLNGYKTDFVSVHDPDEYLAAAINEEDQAKRYDDILGAYRALRELKDSGEVKAIGVGSKDWRAIQKIANDVALDWVMIANSMTVHSHPEELVAFMKELEQKGIAIINAAVFNAGFLIGGDYYNYKLVNPEEHKILFKWREGFFKLCDKYRIKPAGACVAFGLSAPGVTSIALSGSNPKQVKENVEMTDVLIPRTFWDEMKATGLVNPTYAYL